MGLSIEQRYEKAIDAYKMNAVEGKSQREIARIFGVSPPTAANLIREGQKIVAKEHAATDFLQTLFDKLSALHAWTWRQLQDERVSDHAKGKFVEQYNKTAENLVKLAAATGVRYEDRNVIVFDVDSNFGNLRRAEVVLLDLLLQKDDGRIPTDTSLLDLVRQALQEEAEFRQAEREFLQSGDSDARELEHELDITVFPDTDPEEDLRGLKALEEGA